MKKTLGLLPLFAVIASMVAIPPVLATGPPYAGSSGETHISGSCGYNLLESAASSGELATNPWTCSNTWGGEMDNWGSINYIQAYTQTSRAGTWYVSVTIQFYQSLCCDSSRYTQVKILLDVYDQTVGRQEVSGQQIYYGDTSSGYISSGTQTFQSQWFDEGSGTHTLSVTVSFLAKSSIPCCFYSGFSSDVSNMIPDIGSGYAGFSPAP